MLDKLEIGWDTYIHLKPDTTMKRTPNFYFLAKTYNKIVKGRPIISSNGCPTQKISALWMTT